MSNLQPSAQVVELFNMSFKGKLEHFEKVRIDNKQKVQSRNAFAKKYGWIFTLVLSAILDAVFDLDFIFSLFSLAFIYICYINFPAWRYQSAVNKKFNNEVFPYILKNIFNIDYYNKSKKIPKEVFKQSELITYFTQYLSEDYMTGKISTLPFEMAEVELTDTSNKKTHTVFKGLAIQITMPFNFLSHTVISNLGTKSGKLAQVHLEDPVFEESYNTYSNSQQGARYLITPGFMQRTIDFSSTIKNVFFDFDDKKEETLKNLQNSDSSFILKKMAKSVLKHTIQYEFKDNKLLILIPVPGNCFYHGDIDTSIYDLTNIAKIELQILQISKLAEQLNLDYLAARKKASSKFNT